MIRLWYCSARSIFPRYYKLDGTEVYTGGVTIKSPASGQVGNYNIKDFNNDNTPDLYYAGSPRLPGEKIPASFQRPVPAQLSNIL